MDGTSTDKASIEAASKSASGIYCIGLGDCSDIITDALEVGKNSEGKPLKTGEGGFPSGLSGELPRVKQAKIEARNNGVDFDAGIKPDDLKLQNGEVGSREK